MELSEILKITKSCTGFCDGKDCPRYKHGNPAWCLAMNIKELLDAIESQKEHMEYKDEIYAELMESLRLASEANKDMVAKLKDAIVPPCKVGQTVWYIHGGYYKKTNLEARPITVTEISQKKVKDKLQWAFIANGTRYVFGSIGKAVFLSREEAEKALAERSK